MTAWRWVTPEVVIAIHDRQLAEHGGPEGVRNRGSLESALARAQNLAVYGVVPDAADLAAAYAYGLILDRGFVDGNMRTAWVVARLFLADNGYALRFDRPDAVKIVEAVAAGSPGEAQLTAWFRERLEKQPP